MSILKLESHRLEDPSTSSTSLQCVICNEIPLNPKECSNCQNLFCDDCIKTWLELKNVCPCFCSEAPFHSNQAHKFIRDIINNLKVKCPNFELGCVESIRYESLPNHIKNHCLYRKVKCPNDFCKAEIFIKDQEAHIMKCILEEAECPHCKIKFIKTEFLKHQCIAELFKDIKVLENKINENEKKIETLDKELSDLVIESKRKIDHTSTIEKMVKNRVKDLKIYMKNEVEETIKDLLKNAVILETKASEIKKNETLNEDDKKFGFTSKFFDVLHNQNPDDSDMEEENKDKIKNEKTSHSDEEFKTSPVISSVCHGNYENLQWKIEPERLKCGICSHIRLIRYFCKTCRKNICVECKKPCFKKRICPSGHKLTKIKAKEESECDICLETIDKGSQCYSDEICQADVCFSCMDK